MRIILLFFILLACFQGFSQVEDDFSDGDFTENPQWIGTTENFIIYEKQVRLNTNNQSATSYLATQCHAIKNAEWNGWFRTKCSTSSGNYYCYYLTAMSEKLYKTKGYYVMVGDTEDEISLYRQDSTSAVKIIDGKDKRVDVSTMRLILKVTCDSLGEWKLYSKFEGDMEYTLEGSVIDTTYRESNYTGYLCVNSASNSAKYFFDSIYVKGDVYENPPEVINLPDTISKDTIPIPVDTIIPVIENQNPVEPGDLIINEVLFNNSDATEEFVEIYNKSDKQLSLSNVGYTTRKTDGTLNSVKKLPEDAMIEPHAYLALCKTPNVDSMYYGSIDGSKFVAMSSWQSLNNDGATVVICTHSKDTIFDELTYSPDWHHVLIKNDRDVSLERINPNLPTQSSDSWHSASSDVFYATPGYENSQYRDLSEVQESSKSFWLEHESFTPDNDGNNDVLLLNYNMPETGWMANITIFDVSGQIISRLYKSHLLAAEGNLVWDGKADSGKLANIGIYVLYVELHNADKGEVKQYKIPCVVSGN